MSDGLASSAMASRMVLARSAAEIPVVIPIAASMETVKAVPNGEVFSDTIMDNAQVPDTFFGQRKADQTAAMSRHEIDRLWSHFLGGHAQVAFILAIFVIHQDDYFAATIVFDRFFDSR